MPAMTQSNRYGGFKLIRGLQINLYIVRGYGISLLFTTIIGRYSMIDIVIYDHKYPSCPMTDYFMHTEVYANLVRFLHCLNAPVQKKIEF